MFKIYIIFISIIFLLLSSCFRINNNEIKNLKIEDINKEKLNNKTNKINIIDNEDSLKESIDNINVDNEENKLDDDYYIEKLKNLPVYEGAFIDCEREYNSFKDINTCTTIRNNHRIIIENNSKGFIVD